MVTSGVGVRRFGRRLRGAHLGGTFRAAVAGVQAATVGGLRLPAQPAAVHVVPGAQSGRQGEIQSDVLGDQRGQLRVPRTGALSLGPAVPLLTVRAVRFSSY